jgi:choline dehydrogenase-like flavoprotein
MSSRQPERVDVVIVGVGASGATAAKVLSEAGLRVVGLDRGPYLDHRKHFSGDELKFLNRGYIAPNQELSPRTYRTGDQEEALPYPFSPCPQLVGGGTVHWAGWFPRAMPCDFRMRSLHGDVEGATLADWPISYDDLEPHYTKVEWEFGCSGLAGANRHEARRSRGYPTPPLAPTAFAVKFYEGCARMGVNAFPLPMALVTRPHKGRDTHNQTGFWNQYGDPTTTKSTTLTSFVPEALATGRFELRPDCYVSEIVLRPRKGGALHGCRWPGEPAGRGHRHPVPGRDRNGAASAPVDIERVPGRIGEQQRARGKECDLPRVPLLRRAVRQGQRPRLRLQRRDGERRHLRLLRDR